MNLVIWFFEQNKIIVRGSIGQDFQQDFTQPYSEEEIKAILYVLDRIDNNKVSIEDNFIKETLVNLHDNSLPYWDKSKGSIQDDFLSIVGLRLYKSVFCSTAGEFFRRSKDALIKPETLSIYFQFSAGTSNLIKFPWELMRPAIGQSSIVLDENILFFRRIVQPNQLLKTLSLPKSFKPLQITPRPIDVPGIRKADTSLANDICQPATFENLISKIQNTSSEIIHFDGHAIYGSHCQNCNTWVDAFNLKCSGCQGPIEDENKFQNYLIFEDNDQKAKRVSSDDFVEKITGLHPQIIIMDACYTAAFTRGKSDINTVALRLIDNGVPVVIAMQFQIEVEASTKFVQETCKEINKLLNGEINDPVKIMGRSIQVGRRSLEASQSYRPVIYLHSNDEIIISHPNYSFQESLARYKEGWIKELRWDADSRLGLFNYLKNYIPLTCTFLEPDALLTNARKIQNSKKDVVELLMTAQNEVLLLIGGPGSGKTTVLKKVVWGLLELKTAFPVFLNLGINEELGLEVAILSGIKRFRIFEDILDVKNLADILYQHNIDFYLVLDGFNEVNPNKLTKVLNELNLLISKIHPKLVVIASREQSSLLDRLRNIQLSHYMLLESLSDEQVTHHTYKLAVHLDNRLRKFSKTPLILSLLCENPSTDSPINQGELFNIFIEQILKPMNIKEDIVLALYFLAYEMNSMHEVNISRKKAIEIIEKKFSRETALDTLDFSDRCGLLIRNIEDHTNETLSYAPNLLMQEYFSALELKTRIIEKFSKKVFAGPFGLKDIQKKLNSLWSNEFYKRASDPWWSETFIILADLLKNHPKVLDWLLVQMVLKWKTLWLALWYIQKGIQASDRDAAEIIKREISQLDRAMEDTDVITKTEIIRSLLKFTSTDYPLIPRGFHVLLEAAGDRNFHLAKLAYTGLRQAAFKKHINEIDIRNDLSAKSRIGIRRINALDGRIDDNFPHDLILISDSLKNQSVEFLKLKNYWISKYPITQKDYADFLSDAKNKRYPDNWGHKKPPRNQRDHPLHSISWLEAWNYCQWLTLQSGYPVRLPTELEWKRAASGGKKKKYTWGEHPYDDYSQPNKYTKCNSQGVSTTSVKAYPSGKSPDGCFDMLGNVSEWCIKEGNSVYDLQNATMPIKGGSYQDELLDIDHVFHEKSIHEINEPIGFRIVISLLQIANLTRLSENQFKIDWL